MAGDGIRGRMHVGSRGEGQSLTWGNSGEVHAYSLPRMRFMIHADPDVRSEKLYIFVDGIE
jgi:hypothetical protein